MGKIIKILIVFILLIAVTFLSFPIWTPWVVKTQMPTNIDLHTLESDYPGLQGLSIPQIGFKVNDLTINILNLDMDYQLNTISMENLRIEKMTAEDTEVDLIRMPDVDILQLLIIKKINQINISSLQYHEKDIRLQASQLKLKRLDDNVAQISMEDIQLSGETFKKDKTLSSLLLNIKLITDTEADMNDNGHNRKHGSELNVDISGDIQGYVSYKQPAYQEDVGILQLEGSIDLSRASVLSDITVQGVDVKPGGAISFNWQYNRETNVQELLLDSQLLLSDLQHGSRSIQVSPLNDVSSSSIILPVKVNISSSSEQFPIQARVDISTNYETGLQLGSSELDIKIHTPVLNIKTDLTLEDQHFTLEKGLSLISSGKLLIPELIINTPDGRLTSNFDLDWQQITPELSSGTFSIELNSATADFLEYSLDKLQLSSDFKLSAKTIAGNGELKMNQELLTPFTMAADKSSNQWKIVFDKNKLSKSLLNELLNIIGKNEKLQLSINEGEVFHGAKFSFDEKVQMESRLNVSDAVMQFGKNTINGLSVKQELDSLSPLQLKTDLSINDVQFASGLDLKNISSNIVATADDSYEIHSLEGQLFSGELSSQTIRANSDGFAETIIEIDNISLMELFFFMDIPGLYAEGKISFKIPTSLKNGTLIVRDGSFQAEEKGIIKYSTELASSEGEENIALKALENFHYQTLDGTMSYDENGFYKIKLHLLGANPELYDGYPVDFTLNLQGELPGVFRSLFVTGNFEQAVMDRVKSTDVEK